MHCIFFPSLGHQTEYDWVVGQNFVTSFIAIHDIFLNLGLKLKQAIDKIVYLCVKLVTDHHKEIKRYT